MWVKLHIIMFVTGRCQLLLHYSSGFQVVQLSVCLSLICAPRLCLYLKFRWTETWNIWHLNFSPLKAHLDVRRSMGPGGGASPKIYWKGPGKASRNLMDGSENNIKQKNYSSQCSMEQCNFRSLQWSDTPGIFTLIKHFSDPLLFLWMRSLPFRFYCCQCTGFHYRCLNQAPVTCWDGRKCDEMGAFLEDYHHYHYRELKRASEFSACIETAASYTQLSMFLIICQIL